MFTDYKTVTFSGLFVTKSEKNEYKLLRRSVEKPECVEYLGIFTIAIYSEMLYNGHTVVKSANLWYAIPRSQPPLTVYSREVDSLPQNDQQSILDTMLMGTYNQSMDAKGRMSFPAKLREALGEKFIVTKGIDGCLFVYSIDNFEKKAAKIQSLPMAKARALQRSFMAWACEAEPDKQGRILVPQSLRAAAGLDKEIVVAGVCDRCEIWDKQKWDEINSTSESELTDALEGLDF